MKLSAPPPEPDQPDDEPTDTTDDANAADPSPPGSPDKPAPQPVTWPAWFAGLDWLLAALAVAIAFLAASFAARNSDLWLHLAAGQRFLDGTYSLGSDPFSYTAADRPWVNHAWLFDLVAHLIYQANPAILVVLKAVGVAVAAGLLLAIRRPGFALWPWAVFTAVAVVAAAPRLTLAPSTASFVLLAVTLFLLFRLPHRPGSWRLPIAIGVTFLWWANHDEWFFLGPLAVALLLLGQVVEKVLLKRAADDADAGRSASCRACRRSPECWPSASRPAW